MDDDRRESLIYLGENPILAHDILFPHRHPQTTPPFHREIIRDWHSLHPAVLTMAFRGAGKSTLAEETIIIEACFGNYRNIVILGDSWKRAVERLYVIQHEIDFNEKIAALFDVTRGDIWTQDRCTLSNGVMIQAYGRGQSLRGAKHNDARPDFIFLDDLEDEDSVRTKEGRDKTLVWFTSTVMPSLDPAGKMRMAATPLHPEALAVTLGKKPFWRSGVYPIEYKDALGERAATWPERFDLEWIDGVRSSHIQLGKLNSFAQEYLCEAVDQSTRVFKHDMIRIVPRVPSWHATFAMYDPARTTLKTSATTGKVVWSWVGRKLIVWEATAQRWSPSEIIEDVFKIDKQYNPVAIGVEETGLNEWLLQPIRQQSVLRGHTLPLRPVNAPKGKYDFIRGLEPFFRAHEVEFAADLPDLRDQLLGFPNGDIDAPNALAYALHPKFGLGAAVYESFDERHIDDGGLSLRGSPVWLAVNATPGLVTAVVCQLANGQLTVHQDWLEEGQPGETFGHILKEAGAFIGRDFTVVAPIIHFRDYDVVGLRAVARRFPATIRRGGDELVGRGEIRDLLERDRRLGASVKVSTNARWTLRAFTGGYCRRIGAGADDIDMNAYKVLMEGLESFAALFRSAAEDVDSEPNFAYTEGGQRFISARAR